MTSHEKFLGYTVKDRVTGFRGVCTGVVYYMTGCNQGLVVPGMKKDDSGLAESLWFDVQRLVIDETVDKIDLENGLTPGFDMEPPKR